MRQHERERDGNAQHLASTGHHGIDARGSSTLWGSTMLINALTFGQVKSPEPPPISTMYTASVQ
jgi:hypothetical protein